MARAGDGNSGRQHRSRRGGAGSSAAAGAEDDEQRSWHETAQSWPDGDFAVRRVSGSAGKTYRCPGCDQEIAAATPHVVAWPEGRVDDRRHWHTACWSKRLHRAPVTQRSRNAPRL